MNIEALQNTKRLIKDNFGDISDIPEELQNTIVNIHYKVSIIAQDPHELNFKFGPKGVDEGWKKGMKDAIFYTTAVKALPDIVSDFREVMARGNQSDTEFLTTILLFTYKYKIENILSKSYFWARIERFFSAGKIDEIPNLHKQITDHSDHETFEQWYDVYKKVAGEENPQLAIDEDGHSVLDYLEHDPLKKAFKDGFDPKLLAVDYAKHFDISILKVR